MNKKDIRQYLLTKPEAWEDFPFDQKTAVFKVDKKMFALMGFHLSENIMNLKCAP